MQNPDQREPSEYGESRLLTEQERGLLEKSGFRIIKDKPGIIYLEGYEQYPPREFIENIEGLQHLKEVFKHKGIIFLIGGDGDPDNWPTLNQVIDNIVEKDKKFQISFDNPNYAGLKFGRKTADDLANKNFEIDNKPQKEVAGLLLHNNSYSAISYIKDLGKNPFIGIKLWGPENISEAFELGYHLELISSYWLEPHGRAKPVYEGLIADSSRAAELLKEQKEGETPLILENLELLNLAVKNEVQIDHYSLNNAIKKYFNGDMAAFQKRWKEFYENWWPDEFRKMQDAVEKTKEWLKTQKD